MSIQTSAAPSPVSAGTSYTITASGGTAPYAFAPFNVPPGCTVTQTGPDTAEVFVPSGVPSGTHVRVKVSDSSTPTQEATSRNSVT